nr:MAG TPA: hypothetical protein [Caudoviricetes sp.]
MGYTHNICNSSKQKKRPRRKRFLQLTAKFEPPPPKK